MRHAKSSWDNANLADFERPLNERGTNAAAFMGELIAKRGFIPDTIISSPARRAKHTAELLKEAAGINIEIKCDERIYEASPHALRQIVAQLPKDLTSAMLVGHNPGMEGFIKYLIGHLEPMPTASLAVIDLKVNLWSEIDADSGILTAMIRPKDEMKNLRNHNF